MAAALAGLLLELAVLTRSHAATSQKVAPMDTGCAASP